VGFADVRQRQHDDGRTVHAFRLGHTRISATLEIYTYVDEQAKRDALTQLHGLLDQGKVEPLLQTVAT
jgi:hypothetical protein